MDGYVLRPTSRNKMDKCKDPVTGEILDGMVWYDGFTIARIQIVTEGRERGRCNCNTFWYPPQQTMQRSTLEEGMQSIKQLHERVKDSIEQYYHRPSIDG